MHTHVAACRCASQRSTDTVQAPAGCIATASSLSQHEPAHFTRPCPRTIVKHTDTASAVRRYIIDAEGQRLGRMATLVAKYIRGKNSPLYTPSMDTGAMIIIVNAEKVTVTGRKFDQKLYKRHVNGLPGSMKVETFKQLQARLRRLAWLSCWFSVRCCSVLMSICLHDVWQYCSARPRPVSPAVRAVGGLRAHCVCVQARLPERIVEKAVWGMLPKGRLGRKIKHNMFVRSSPLCWLGI